MGQSENPRTMEWEVFLLKLHHRRLVRIQARTMAKSDLQYANPPTEPKTFARKCGGNRLNQVLTLKIKLKI